VELSSTGNERVATTSHCTSGIGLGTTERNSVGDTDGNDDGTLVLVGLVEGVVLGSLDTVGYPEGTLEGDNDLRVTGFAVEGVLDLVIDGEALTVLVGKPEGDPDGDNGLRVTVLPTGDVTGFAVEGVLDLVTDGEALTILVRNAEGAPRATMACG